MSELRPPSIPHLRPPSIVAPPTSAEQKGPSASQVIAASSASGTSDDFFAFCKRTNPKEFEKIVKEGQLIQCGPDSIIYLQGEPSDSFYVINDGMVEVVIADDQGQNPVPIAKLEKGELFGEIGLLMDSPRSASMRVPESATLLRYDRDAFQRLITSHPAFGQYLAMSLSRRLQKTTAQLHFYSNARELSGSLSFFDLPTIFQTISLSQQHGIMHVFNLTSEILGEFAFNRGTPVSARYQHLYGMEALFQLFQVTPNASFGFSRCNEEPIVESPLDIRNVNDFVMHAVHLKDEMSVLQEKLKISDDQPLKRVHSRLEWQYSDLKDCAQGIWQTIIKEPLPLKTIESMVPFCRHNVLQVVDRLFETSQLAFAEITPYGYR
jgi:CRP-like cAMP-binding protein